ncbi:MAG TPA: hypothetical protein VFL83_14965 [Anaeromyxobacter sp.]|nr:hypothetical protein [Anaeromyxobacter sp.]
MALSGVMTLVLALGAAAGDRLLLCRPNVAGDAALARPEAVLEAARRAERFLDYGVPCVDAGESARAARRAGLAHAVSATAEGRVDGSHYVLVLADVATEAERARQSLDVAPGADAVPPLRASLAKLMETLPRKPGPDPKHVAAWAVAGAGAAAVIAGVVVAGQARDAADRANSAADLGTWVEARDEWERKRTTSGVLFGVGAAALAAGLTWRFAF